MFQGGSSATIHPVMGGGGALPAGFEQQSLLQGGEGATIHPVQGGGAGASSPLILDEGTLQVPADGTLPDGFDELLQSSRAGLVELEKNYILKQRDGVWRRYNAKAPLAVERPRILTTENCAMPSTGRLNDAKGEAGFDRLAVILPKATEEILLFPPVQSSRRRFYSCLEYLKGEGLIDSNGDMKGPAAKAAEVGGAKKVILFAPPFFKLEGDKVDQYLETNRKLMAHFLKLKAQYPHMYILAQSTAMNKMIGNCLASGASSAPLLNMLEPTYVIYPFVRMQEELNALDPFADTVKKPVGGIIFSAAAENEAMLPASNLPSKLAAPSTYLQKGERTAVAYLPNPKVEDAEINKMYVSLKLRFYGEGATIMNPERVKRYIVQASPAAAAGEAVGATADVFTAAEEHELALDDMTYTRVPLDGRVFSFRAPGAAGVLDDWKAMHFTSDEAAFLNELQLRPSLLLKIYEGEEVGPTPPERLAAFLQNMAIGRCFTDERMLTASECQDSRDFVNRVYNYYLMHDERVEELKDAEAEARKRAARFRVQTAEERMRDAEAAERAARQDAETLLARIRKNAEFMGVDLERSSDDYMKSPVGVGGRIKTVRDGGYLRSPTKNSGVEGGYEIGVIVFKRSTGDYWIGAVDYIISEGQDETTKAKELLDELNKEYPGYYIIQDFD
jgi:hypothetical protein